MGKRFTELENSTTKRFVSLGIVILLHLIVLYGLSTALSKKVETPTEVPVEALIFQDTAPKSESLHVVNLQSKSTVAVKKTAKMTHAKTNKKPLGKAKSTSSNSASSASSASSATDTELPASSPQASSTSTSTASSSTTTIKPKGETRGVITGEKACKRPEYPDDAIAKKEQGSVIVSLFVSRNGVVKESKIKKTTGSKALDQAAAKAFSLCGFKPALKDGEPEDAWYDIPYEFELDE
ncbi:energy transducer TonB [Acinetobacter wuhouensis]|nr:energy transducer TonB [Acinetobacter wuhouensis]